jgi:hypothetical protein
VAKKFGKVAKKFETKSEYGSSSSKLTHGKQSEQRTDYSHFEKPKSDSKPMISMGK